MSEPTPVTVTDAEAPEQSDAAKAAHLRNLVVSGGEPYVLLVVAEDGIKLTHQGIDPDFLAPAFRELAEALDGTRG